MEAGSAHSCVCSGHRLKKNHRKILKGKRILILNHVANNRVMSLSSILRYINKNTKIPLSTLKFNVKLLLQEGFIEHDGLGEPIRLTCSGRKLLCHIEHQNRDNGLIS